MSIDSEVVLLDKHSRAGKFGTVISCPQCKTKTIVYHMAWSAISCGGCREMIDKDCWIKVRHV